VTCRPTALVVHHAAHIYVAPVASMQPAGLEDLLDSAETARSGSFQSESARRRFIGAHVLLRTVLGEFVGVAPQNLRFDHGPCGKPRLANNSTDSVWFSLAHSGELALAAISATSEVGVDVERMRPIPEALAIAERAFDSSSCIALHETAPEHRDATFLRQWTRLEALAKATGCGLAPLLEQEELSGAGRIVERLGDEYGRRARRFEVIDLPLESGYVGTLAVESHTHVPCPVDQNHLARRDALPSTTGLTDCALV
jgi:4'-phosphopantetheinyl transferase